MADGRDKAAFRRWARENHPDVGGDPDRFAEAARAFQEGRWAEFLVAQAVSSSGTSPPVYVKRRPRSLSALLSKAKRKRRHQPPRVR
jgi:hypothetical protein